MDLGTIVLLIIAFGVMGIIGVIVAMSMISQQED